jgi:hypothetical protein
MGPERPELALAGPRAGGEAAAGGGHLFPHLRLGRLGIVVVLAWLAVMVAGGWVLAASQTSNRKAMAGRLEARTKYAASFISI